jgi:phage gp29-like protein
MYAARLGSLLKPARIASILSAADLGQPAALHDLLNELRQKDGVLHSILQTRETALLGVGWSIQPFILPGKKKATKQAETIAAFCSERIAQIKGLDRAIAHLSDAVYKGYAVAEVLWQKQGKYLVPSEVICHQGRRVAFDNAQKLRWFDDGLKPLPGDDFLAQYPYRFLVHQPRINGDAPTREGLGRELAWLACFRNWAYRDWMLLAELYGKPWKIVKLDRSKAQAEDETVAQDIADNATSSTAVVIYDSIDLEIRWPEAKGGGATASPSPAILAEAAKDMALSVLGQQATTGQVSGGLGGKGAAHEAVRRDILKADDRALSATLRDGLLWAMTALNFGPKAPVPWWSFNTADAVDSKAFVEMLDVAVNKLGAQVPASYFHDESGIPAPANGEAVLRGASPAPAAAPKTGQPTPPPEDQAESEPDPADPLEPDDDPADPGD